MLIQNNLNTVWFYLSLVHNNTTLMYIKNTLHGNRWLWRWDEGLEAASRKVLQCREADGGQSSRSPFEAAPRIRQDLEDYFVRSQELMTQSGEAGE